MKIRNILLSIIAVLSLGLTSCTDEIGSDQTSGQPGYLTINVKNIKPNQSKLLTANPNDFKLIKDLNVFVFTSGGQLILNKYYDNGTNGTLQVFDLVGGATAINIPVSTLPAGAYVVCVANYGSRMTTITTYASLEETPLNTIKDFSTTGLYMTGRGDISAINPATYTYSVTVKIAPVEAKITVNWALTSDAASFYDITGVYVVNAISNTKMPIILTTTTANATTNINPTATMNNINLIGTARTVLSGYPIASLVAGKDFHFYTQTLNAGLLSNEKTDQITGGVLNAGYSVMPQPFCYYVGENYANNAAVNAGAGLKYANNASQNANTMVVLRASPKSTAPAYIITLGTRYYTYELNKASNLVNSTNLGSVAATDGFSVRRKTNYNLTFNLSEMGTANPFERINQLSVSVTATDWDPAAVTFP